MATVLITGGTGLIGTHLSRKLIEKGYAVRILGRSGNSGSEIPVYHWDWEKGEIDTEALESADYIIHLAGANIGDKRWSKERKLLIADSRVKSAELLFEKIKAGKNRPKAVISASATGFYGASSEDKIFTEDDPPGNDFLGNTCSQWERAVDRFNELGIRTVKLRAGVVLTKRGGVLAKMALPLKMGIGSPLGTGKQFLPWIHIDDLCSIYIKALEDARMNGAFNAVAPDYTTNAEFTSLLAKALNKPFWFPNVPSAMIKLIFGEMSVTVLKGNRVSAEKILSLGCEFKFPDPESALKDLLGKK